MAALQSLGIAGFPFGLGAAFGAVGGPFYNGFGSIGVNSFGVPYGSYSNYELMDRNPTVALAQATSDAPIKSAEISYESWPGLPKKIVQFIREEMTPWEKHILNYSCRARDDGNHVEEIVFKVGADGKTHLEKFKPLLAGGLAGYANVSLPTIGTTARVDDKGNLVAIENRGTIIDDTRRFYWITYDSRGVNLYGRSRKENFKKPWLRQEYLYDILEYAMNIVVRPVGWVSYPYGLKDNNGNVIDLSAQATQIGEGLMNGKFVKIPNPFAKYAESMIKNGIDPTKVKPYDLGFYDAKSDSGQGFKTFFDQTDKAIVSGHLMPPRSILEAEHGSRADATSHADIGTMVCQQFLDQIAHQISLGIINTLLEINFGPEYRGAVWWKPSPLADKQLSFNNDLIKNTLGTPNGIPLFQRVVDIAAMLERSGVKTVEFDQDQLLEDMLAAEQAKKAVTVQDKGDEDAAKKGKKLSRDCTEYSGTHALVPQDGEHREQHAEESARGIEAGAGDSLRGSQKGMMLDTADEEKRRRDDLIAALLLLWAWMEESLVSKGKLPDDANDRLSMALLGGMRSSATASIAEMAETHGLDVSQVLAAEQSAGKRLTKLADKVAKEVNKATVRNWKDKEGTVDPYWFNEDRAAVIAGDQLYTAGVIGEVNAAKQAGLVGRWVTVGDERVCTTCLGFEGREIDPYKGPWPVVDSHVGCRCDVSYSAE